MLREAELEERLTGLGADREGTLEHPDLRNDLAGEIAFTQPARSFESPMNFSLQDGLGRLLGILCRARAAPHCSPGRWASRSQTGGHPMSANPMGPDSIVLIHGFWVTPRSWEHWVTR